jgi:NADH:ubiquinone oxidoreductase subunit C
MTKNKIDISQIETVLQTFYDAKLHHFVTINGVQIADNLLEVQYIFSNYDDAKVTLFYDEIGFETPIPSVEKIIKNASIAQRELVDMFGVEVAQTQKGLYLDSDSPQAPLKDAK